MADCAAGPQIEVHLEYPAFGSSLREMPPFRRLDRYINVPLESTCEEAYRGMPACSIRSDDLKYPVVVQFREPVSNI